MAEDAPGLIEQLADATLIHLDARVLALYLVGDAGLGPLASAIMGGLRDGEIDGQTSSLSLYQVLAEVYRAGREELAGDVARALQVYEGLAFVDATPDIAVQAAQVRAQLGGRPERAFQIATALSSGAQIYVTTGSGIRRIVGMTVVNLEDHAAPA